MINRTRKKFVLVTMLVAVAIIVAFSLAILGSTYSRNTQNAYRDLEMLLKDVGRDQTAEPPGERPDKVNKMRSFVLKLDVDGNVLSAEGGQAQGFFSDAELVEYKTAILKTGKSKGKVGDIYYRVEPLGTGSVVVAMDIGIENEMLKEQAGLMGVIALLATAVIFLLVWVLSYQVIKPVQTAIQKQKRFISDASHEFKTPLTVASANSEMLLFSLENAAEEQKTYAENILAQTKRLSDMVGELITLTQMDEQLPTAPPCDLDLSVTLLTAILPFESVAYEQQKTLEVNIPSGVTMLGRQDEIQKAAAILLDNAIKHSNPHATIVATLKKVSGKTIFTVENPTAAPMDGDPSKLFERFYRGSVSRGKTTGAGLGLSILHALAEQNKWRLQAGGNESHFFVSITF